MASASGPLPIYYTPDVHHFYIKQKHEFHFNQKSDNEFLMFLLDTAVRVISIVQHLAPVIEAVSDASAELDENDGIEDLSPANTPNPTLNVPGRMEVDSVTGSATLPLSIELEQINQEITNAQISSQQSSKVSFTNTSSARRVHQSYQTSDPEPMYSAVQSAPMQTSAQSSTMQSVVQSAPMQISAQSATMQPVVQSAPMQISAQSSSMQSVVQSAPMQIPAQSAAIPAMQSVVQLGSMQTESVPHSAAPLPFDAPLMHPACSTSLPAPSEQSASHSVSEDGGSAVVYQEAPDPLPPNIPVTQHPSSAQSSENVSTNLPSVRQPVAGAPSSARENIKTEQPVPEIIEIKEEMDENFNESSSAELIPPDALQHLMTSISGTEDNSGIQNFVPTATLSSLPPSFLDRGSNNPLSMVGSMNTGDGPGPSGLNISGISESMMKNINDAGLNVSSIKGQANPMLKQELMCPTCGKSFASVDNVKVHVNTVHKKLKASSCRFCGRGFGQHSSRSRHEKKCCMKIGNLPMFSQGYTSFLDSKHDNIL